MTTLEKAIKTYGADMQLNVAIEELSELIKEICKNKRGRENVDCIIEEIADCYIMLKQLEIIFNIDYKDIHNMINNKINRLQKRLEKVNKQTEAEEKECSSCGHFVGCEKYGSLCKDYKESV